VTAGQVTKTYTRAEDCRAALGNYRFLAALDTLARPPRLISTGTHTLTFARVPGRHAEPADAYPGYYTLETGFVLDPTGYVVVRVYSCGAIGQTRTGGRH